MLLKAGAHTLGKIRFALQRMENADVRPNGFISNSLSMPTITPTERTVPESPFVPKASLKGRCLPLWALLPSTVCIIFLGAFVPDYAIEVPCRFPPIAPSAFVFLLSALTIGGIASKGTLPMDATTRWFLGWCLGFLTLCSISFMETNFDPGALGYGKDRIYGILVLTATFLVGRDRRGRTYLHWGLAAVLLLDLIFVGWDTVLPGTFSRVVGRAAGLFRNPTIAGQGLVAASLLFLEDLSEGLSTALFFLVGLAVFATFSRGSMLSWILIACLGWCFGLWKSRRILMVQLGGMFLLFLTLALLSRGGGTERFGFTLSEDLINRIHFGIGDTSGQERSGLFFLAWQMIMKAPLLGHGLGAYKQMGALGPHNMHLSLWIDHGLLGLVVLPALLRPLWKSGPSGRIFIIYSLFFAFFTHNMIDERNYLIPLAALLARAGLPPSQEGNP